MILTLNEKVWLEDKEKLISNTTKILKNMTKEDFINNFPGLLLLIPESEIGNLSHIIIRENISGNDYTFIIFLIKLFSIIND